MKTIHKFFTFTALMSMMTNTSAANFTGIATGTIMVGGKVSCFGGELHPDYSFIEKSIDNTCLPYMLLEAVGRGDKGPFLISIMRQGTLELGFTGVWDI